MLAQTDLGRVGHYRVRWTTWLLLGTLICIVLWWKPFSGKETLISWQNHDDLSSDVAFVNNDGTDGTGSAIGHAHDSALGTETLVPNLDHEPEPPLPFLRHWPMTGSISSLVDDGCSSAPPSDNLMIVIKTGTSELSTKLPTHLLTTCHCISHDRLRIYSDLDDVYAGHVIHDAVKNVSKYWQEHNEDFAVYRELIEARSLGMDVTKLSGERSWNLDKWKFLPMTFDAYGSSPATVEWFLFIEADTSLSWLNLLLWLKTLNPAEEIYLGAPRIVGDTSFAHGGSGYLMSRPAIAKLAAQRAGETPELYDARWENHTSESPYGDAILSEAMLEAGVKLEDGDPFLNADNVHTADLTESKLCKPSVTQHHVDGSLVSDLWRFQTDWIRMNGWGKAYLWRDMYDFFTAEIITSVRGSWDNLCETRRLISPDAATEEEKGSDWFVSRRTMTKAEKLAIDSPEHCKVLCEQTEWCMQWQWKTGRCYLGDVIRAGQREGSQRDDTTSPWTSGWHQARVLELREKVKDCAWTSA